MMIVVMKTVMTGFGSVDGKGGAMVVVI